MKLAFLDWVIIITLLIFIYRGFKSGFVLQMIGLLGSVVALILAFNFYNPLGGVLAEWLKISENLGGILGFILIMVAISAIATVLSKKWKNATDNSSISIIDGLAGALFGALKTLLVWVLVLLLLSSLQFEFIQRPLVESTLAKDVLKLAPFFHFLQDRALPANVPRLFLTPEGVQIRKIKYEDLDGSTCLACGREVSYKGLVRKGLFSFPLFECTACHRQSDGCQTYEGYHLFYRRCPWDGKTPISGSNCEIWVNPVLAFPAQTCPVCGKNQTSKLHF